jgi:7-cyano-7-deazaguanine synthase
MNQDTLPSDVTAVLVSGGLDSAVLLASEAVGRPVRPIYVIGGLAWEDEELSVLGYLLKAPVFSGAGPLVRLHVDTRDVFPATHWALRGSPPAYDTPDEDVYLPGRNVLLIAKAGLYCAMHGIRRLALGPLAGNPFPDATPEFFAAMERALSLGFGTGIRVVAPLASKRKAEVIRLGLELGVPLERTLSCMNPTGGLHCGMCSKCRERHDAFDEAGIEDPTPYGAEPPAGG